MGLPKYFTKSGLSAASVLNEFSLAGFEHTLDANVIGIVAADDVAKNEGVVILDMLVELLGRLYPRISVTCPAGAAERVASRLRSINASIEVLDDIDAATVIVGIGSVSRVSAAPTLFVGSDGWSMRFSDEEPQCIGDSGNPFGGAGAACIAAAWVFNKVFETQLPKPLRAKNERRTRVVSLLEYEVTNEPRASAWNDVIDIGETFLVGIGAIGNAASWVLSRAPLLGGRLHLIDPQRVDAGNLQRYVLTNEASVGDLKVSVAASEFGRLGSRLEVRPHPVAWDFHAGKATHRLFDRVLLALDTADDRMRVQASLPRWVVNSWTQPENCGVSRHPDPTVTPCVACLYLPTQKRKNKDQVVADALSLSSEADVMKVRVLLHSGEPMGEQFVKRIAEVLGKSEDTLLRFADAPLDVFYTNEVCGGRLLVFENAAAAGTAQVPMAFQSAFAGIALAAEVVADAGQLRLRAMPARTEVDLLRGIRAFDGCVSSPAQKHASGRCICQDPVYLRAYRAKYHPTTTR